MNKRYTLFGIPFATEQLLHETLMDISYEVFGLNHYEVYNSGFYYKDEGDIILSLIDTQSLESNLNDIRDEIIKLIKIINLKTSHKINHIEIKEKILSELQGYLEIFAEEALSDSEIIEYFKSNSNLWGYLNPELSECKTKIYFEMEETPQKINQLFDVTHANQQKEDYYSKYGHYSLTECETDISSEKCDYAEEQVEIKLSCLRKEIDERLKNYSPIGTDNELSLIQKKKGILNTFQIIKDTIHDTHKIKELDYTPLKIIENKMIHKDRNQRLERLSKLLQEANANYVLKDDEGSFFYPFIANIFFAHYTTESILKKHSDLLTALRAVEYESKKIDKNEEIIISDKLKQVYDFHSSVHKNQIWNYVTTVYAHQYNTNFKSMSKLIKFFIYPNPRVNNQSLKTPTLKLPNPLTPLDKFTQDL